MAELTPMMRQYLQIKEEHPDCLLFFRLGDFYEMFYDDAKTGSEELGLTLTTRDRNKPEDERTPMCGVPYHSAQNYIARLIKRGYKVAICEQMEDPALAKGLVERDVIRIVTPGTAMDDVMLDESRNNYICAIYRDSSGAALARCDMSEAVADAFRYSKLVLATTTYNGDIFPFMRDFIDHLTERSYANRTVAFIENGSWTPTAARIMKGKLEKCKNLTFAENVVTVKCALNEDSSAALTVLKDALCRA